MSWLKFVGALIGLLCLGAAPNGGTLIRGARVFDGTGAPATPADVLVQGDRIVAVGPRLRAPRGPRVVNARGMTLIPGLHDLHAHLRASGFSAPEDLGKAYAGHLVHGVTTVNDFSVSGEMLAPIREMSGSDAVTAPNLMLAIRLGVPQGHGTEYGWGDVFTLQATTPRAAEIAMRRALAYRPNVIKVFTDGWRYGRSPDLDSMNLPTLRTIVERAHEAGIPVITHTVTLAGAKIAAAAGVDALGHGIGDAIVDDELIALMRSNATAYVPTMVVYEPQQDRVFASGEWRMLRPQERAREEAQRAQAPEPIPDYEARRWAILRENLRRLKAGGVRIGTGTDAGIGGVYQGSSAVREVRVLTEHGFTPAEALAAATSVSAGILRQADDHGRIAPGQRADLVLVGGRPDERIEDLYDVRQVFVAGRKVGLSRSRALLDSGELSPLPSRGMPGSIDTGARTDGRTDLDTLPVETNESGIDHSHLYHVRTPERRLFLYARMGAEPQPYANLVLPLTPGAIHLADARGFAGIAFEARGTGRYSLLLESYGIAPRESFRTSFDAGEAGREVIIPFSTLQSPGAATLDLARLRALVFRMEGEPGDQATLELGNIRFYRAP